MTQITAPSAAGQEHVISLTIFALAVGMVLGSVATLVFIRKKMETKKKLKQS